VGGATLSQPMAGPSSESAAPGRPSDAGAPETADPTKPRQKADLDPARGKPAGRPVEARHINPPRSAVALRASTAASASVRKAALPGDYQTTEETRRALAAAHAGDLAPFRKAAEPLLASIEAGNLEVVGELESFIARLDELAPTAIGASQLADVLEAALAEASIAGAAGVYGKISSSKT